MIARGKKGWTPKCFLLTGNSNWKYYRHLSGATKQPTTSILFHTLQRRIWQLWIYDNTLETDTPPTAIKPFWFVSFFVFCIPSRLEFQFLWESFKNITALLVTKIIVKLLVFLLFNSKITLIWDVTQFTVCRNEATFQKMLMYSLTKIHSSTLIVKTAGPSET